MEPILILIICNEPPQRYFFPLTSLLITVENVSIVHGKNLRNEACIIQKKLYYAKRTNKAKKLASFFKASINIFFSPVSLLNLPKVINFAHYQQDVNEAAMERYRRLIIKRNKPDALR